MNRRTLRLWLAALLYAIPVLAFAGAGAVALYNAGWLMQLLWVASGCWLVAWLCWNIRPRPAAEDAAVLEETNLPRHWTARDRTAWKVVQEFQHNAARATAEELIEPQWYFETARLLAERMAREYHPGSRDAVGALSAVEVLTAAQLVLTDLTEWFRSRVPGSHLITIGQWQRLGRLPRTLDAPLSAVKYGWWVVGSWLDPTRLPRYLMQEASWQGMKSQLLLRFAREFIERAGFYLVELNSGRLQAGPEAWQATLGGAARGGSAVRTEDSARAGSPRENSGIAASANTTPVEITVAVAGQVNAGKSSLINALLGEVEAAADILPTTREVKRFVLPLDEAGSSLCLLDTPGIDEAGHQERRFDETLTAVQQADLLLLVLDARNPARQADAALLKSLDDWFEQQPQRRRPPAIGVLTHVDLLPPPLEWSPPYDWQEPAGTKEQGIHDAVEHNRELFGNRLAGVIPVCCGSDPTRRDGVQEYLLPAMMVFLDEARGCALLRVLHGQIDANRYRQVFRQLWQAGHGLVTAGLAAAGGEAEDGRQ